MSHLPAARDAESGAPTRLAEDGKSLARPLHLKLHMSGKGPGGGDMATIRDYAVRCLIPIVITGNFKCASRLKIVGIDIKSFIRIAMNLLVRRISPFEEVDCHLRFIFPIERRESGVICGIWLKGWFVEWRHCKVIVGKSGWPHFVRAARARRPAWY